VFGTEPPIRGVHWVDFDEVVRHSPTFAITYSNRGLLYIRIGETGRLRRAQQYDSDD
jgi:hypothetical protein